MKEAQLQAGPGRTEAPLRTTVREDWEENARLPEHLIPLHYQLYLHPDLQEGTFKGLTRFLFFLLMEIFLSGRVRIDILATKPADYFLVHSKGLDIQETELEREGAAVPLQSVFEFTQHQFWVVIPQSQAGPGNYSLTLVFSGSLSNGITGFYKSLYRNAQGENVPIATSKFQPTDARKAFPCFDEPSFKSRFSVTLVRPSEGYIALSNMPVEQETANTPSPGS